MESKPTGTETLETLEIGIDGMTCDHCARRVEKALLAQPGVKSVRVDRAGARVAVTIDGKEVGLGRLHETITKSGYRPLPAG